MFEIILFVHVHSVYICACMCLLKVGNHGNYLNLTLVRWMKSIYDKSCNRSVYHSVLFWFIQSEHHSALFWFIQVWLSLITTWCVTSENIANSGTIFFNATANWCTLVGSWMCGTRVCPFDVWYGWNNLDIYVLCNFQCGRCVLYVHDTIVRICFVVFNFILDILTVCSSPRILWLERRWEGCQNVLTLSTNLAWTNGSLAMVHALFVGKMCRYMTYGFVFSS